MTATVLERVPLNPQLLASLRQRLGDRLSTSAAVCEQHGKDESYHAPHAPDAVAFAHSTEEVAAIVRLCARSQDAGHRLRHRHLARRPCRRAARRRLHRPVADEPGPARQRRGSRRDGRGRRHAQAAERASARHRPVLPDRSRRRRDARRHGGDARLGHQRGALRHDARERAGADRRARRRQGHPHRAARPQVGRRLRSDPAVRRLRRHARRSSPR